MTTKHHIDGFVSVSVEDHMIGEHLARLQILRHLPDDEGRDAFTVDLSASQLRSLRTHIDNALDGLAARRFQDAVCGDCPRCGNTRMVDFTQHGRLVRQGKHCPDCQAKMKPFVNWQGWPLTRGESPSPG